MDITTPTKNPPCRKTETIVMAPTRLHSYGSQLHSSEYEDGTNHGIVDSSRLVVPLCFNDVSEYTQPEFPHVDDDSAPDLGIEHLSCDDGQYGDNRDDSEDETEETDEERRRREEKESEALARQLLAEEAMASYQQSADFLREHASDYNEEDLATLQAIMAEEAAAEENQYDNEGHGDGIIDSSELSYEHLLQLGEEIGDVKTEMWVMRAKEEIDKLPIVVLTEEIMSEKNNVNDCCVKCLICQFSYEIGERTRVLPCGHFFHCDCVDQWLLNKDVCPYCRQSIVES